MRHAGLCGTLAIAAVTALVPAARAASADGRVTVERSATVNGASIRLADVATLDGNGATLAEVELGPAPAPGTTRRLAGAMILRRLTESGLDAAATRYQIPPTVIVSRAYQEIAAAELTRAVEDDAPAALAEGERLGAVDVGMTSVRIPPGGYETRLTAVGPARGATRRFTLVLEQDGAKVASVPVRVEVEAFGPVVTARRAIARGALISADDLAVEERDLGGPSTALVRNPADAIGKEANVALAAGTPIAAQALASPLLVRRGDVVTLVVETAGMRLSLPGEALEAGSAGARVRAVNRRSKQEIAGHVVDRGIVLVQY